ncbi:MAG: peptide deformylase [Pirellulales bacterium]
MQIIQYPHPTLRHVSKPLKRVDAELRAMVARMFELMYAHKGVGLAANQVDLPYRFFVTNVEGDPQTTEAERVYINPVLSHAKGMDEAEEGCLSIPGVHGQVKRAACIRVTAYDLSGKQVDTELSGLSARVVQHETDHLDGVLFIDRLSPTSEIEVRESLEEFELQFVSRRQLGEIPPDAHIADRLASLETLRA